MSSMIQLVIAWFIAAEIRDSIRWFMTDYQLRRAKKEFLDEFAVAAKKARTSSNGNYPEVLP